MIRTYFGRSPARLARRLATLVGGGILASALGTSALGIPIASAQTPNRQTPNPQAPNPCRADERAAGQVSGTVSDPQGARAVGAAVSVRCAAGELIAVTDSDGRFTLDLPAGNHQIRVTLDGFEPVVRAVPVSAGATATLDLVLQVAGLADAVTVRASGGTVVRRSTTATRTDTPLLETPQSVSVITAKQINEQASPNLQETLRYTPGVRNELYGIDNRGDWFSLRGSDQSTVLLNGMRLPLTGWYGVMREEPYNFDQVAVLRGPASIIAGQNGPGGVVNLVSKRPQAASAREVSVRLGNYNHREIRIDTTGPLDANRNLLYRLVAVGKDADTQIEHADTKRALIAPSLTWRGARGSITGYGEYQYERSKNTNAFLGLEGTLYPAPNGPIPTDVFIGEPDWDRYGGTRRRAGYESSLTLTPNWRVRHSLRHDRVSGLMKSMYASWWDGFVDADGAADPDGQYLGRMWYVSDDHARVTATEGLLEGRQRTGRIEHRLLFGIDGLWDDSSQTIGEGVGTPLDVYSPVYGSFAEPTTGDASPVDTAIRRAGFFAQDQMKIADRLSVRAGIRRDRVTNTVVGGEGTLDWATTGNVGVVYEVAAGIAPYASYSQSFDPVSGTDAAGAVFKPKRGEQIEAGLKWEPASVPVQASGAYYTIEERNRLVTDPENFGKNIQLGEAKIKGVELEARGEVKSWTLLGSYTWSQARATAGSFGGDLDSSQQLEGIPEHQSSVWITHDLTHAGLAGMTVGGGLRYIGRLGDGTGNVFVPDVTLFDLMASYSIRNNWRVSLNVNNLTDKSYIATCLARGDCWFGQRRVVSVTTGFTY
jgi:iron complex outermembrane receptor protein